MRKRNLLWLIVPAIAFIIVVFVFPKLKKEYEGCREEKEMKAENFRALVKQKFVDSDNHNFQVLILIDRQNNKTIKKIVLNEYGDMFKLVVVGDSILKQSDDSLYIVKHTDSSIDSIIFESNCRRD